MAIIIVRKDDDVIIKKGEQATIVSTGIQVDNGAIFADADKLSIYELDSVDNILVEKHCYNQTDGLYENPNYVEYLSPEEKIANLKAKVTQQDEIIDQLLIDSLMGGA